MNKKKVYIKRSVTILLIIIMIGSCFIPTIAYAEEQRVTEDEAKYLAFACVWDMQSCTDFFGEEIQYSDIFTLYDANLNPSAYVVNFVDENGNPNGYVVIGATSDYSEIIEFSDEGQSSYEDQYALVNNRCEEKVYSFYEGNVTPLCIDKKGTNLIEFKNGKVNKVPKTEKKATIKYSVTDRKNKADKVKQTIDISGGGSSNLGKDNFPMTNPFQYESGYKSYSADYVLNYSNLSYKTDSNFPDVTNACGPIAATNLMIYWKNRDSSKYSGFMRGDSTWSKTFDELCSLMHFFNTTAIWTFATETERFMDTYSTNGFQVLWGMPTSNSWNLVKTEIKTNGYPIVLLLQNHSRYGDHYVIGFGYISFVYEDGTYSNYVSICDGWSSTANRYINFTKGFDSGSIYTVTVRPD